MADWSLLGGGQRYEDDGVVTNSEGTTITGGAADTKGVYTELIATTSFDAQEIIVSIYPRGAGSTYLVDIAVGANPNETVIIPNILVGAGERSKTAVVMSFPISIPAGSRISSRLQDTSGGDRCFLKVQLIGKGFLPTSPGGKITDIGADTANSKGTAVDPGAVGNTKGAYSELVASSAEDYRGVSALIDCNENAAMATAAFLLDIAIGAGGSEVVVIFNLSFQSHTLSDSFSPSIWSFMPLEIPAGTRISARAQSDSTDAVDRLFNVILHGVA